MSSASHSFLSFITFLLSLQTKIFILGLDNPSTCVFSIIPPALPRPLPLCLQVVFAPFPHKNSLKILWLLLNKSLPEMERTPGCWNLQEEMELEKRNFPLLEFAWISVALEAQRGNLELSHLHIFAYICLWICQALRDLILKFEIKP